MIHDRDISRAMGVNVTARLRARLHASAFSSPRSAAPSPRRRSRCSPASASAVILLSFAVVVIGGLGSVEGAAIGALFVGLARAAAIHLVPVGGACSSSIWSWRWCWCFGPRACSSARRRGKSDGRPSSAPLGAARSLAFAAAGSARARGAATGSCSSPRLALLPKGWWRSASSLLMRGGARLVRPGHLLLRRRLCGRPRHAQPRHRPTRSLLVALGASPA